MFVGADMKPAPAVAAQFRRSRTADPRRRQGVQFQGRSAHGARHPRAVRSRRVEADRRRRRAGQGQRADRHGDARRFRVRKGRPARRRSTSLSRRRQGRWDGAAAADFALGLRLRGYRFDKYKTRKKETEEENAAPPEFTIGSSHAAAARAASHERFAVAEGVEIARNLVNEPPNVLFPAEFADRAKALEKLGVEANVLDEKAMGKLGMNALLGVGRGSARESRLVTLRWNGARSKRTKPVAVIGKGVCFDSGGISIKPAAGMEDMKGDMGGAACVVGPHACAGDAQGQGQCRRRHRPRREHARRRRHPPGRHPDLDVRTDDRGRQHRRRGPAGARRRALVRAADVLARGR